MELRSTGNPGTSNPVAMSMLEYLAKRGCKAMSEKITHAQRIRNMTDEELVTFLMEFDTCTHCENSSADGCTYETCEEIGRTCLLDWLKQLVEE